MTYWTTSKAIASELSPIKLHVTQVNFKPASCCMGRLLFHALSATVKNSSLPQTPERTLRQSATRTVHDPLLRWQPRTPEHGRGLPKPLRTTAHQRSRTPMLASRPHNHQAAAQLFQMCHGTAPWHRRREEATFSNQSFSVLCSTMFMRCVRTHLFKRALPPSDLQEALTAHTQGTADPVQIYAKLKEPQQRSTASSSCTTTRLSAADHGFNTCV